MKKIIIILSFIPLFSISQSKEFILDSKTPENVVNALFHVMETQDWQMLCNLCDPKGEGDGDTKSICQLSIFEVAGSAGNKTSRIKFAKGAGRVKISGAAEFEEYDGEEYAKVPISFLDLEGKEVGKEEFKLIKRDGKWYLLSI